MAPALPFRPIVVETAAAGRLRIIHTVRDAAEQLVGDWPAEHRGTLWRGACAACHSALAETGGDAASARAAFILAAKEAGIFVREGGGTGGLM